MGLFGYGEKDYKKNAAEFKKKVNDLLNRYYALGSVEPEAGNALNDVLALLDNTPFPKGAKGKDIDAVDSRINGLLVTLMRDIQEKNPAKFSEHAQMLKSAVEDSRQYGKELYTEKDIQMQESLATLRGQMANAERQKGEIAQKKAQLVKQGQRLTGPTQAAGLAQIKRQFDDLTRQEQTLDNIIRMNQSRYTQAQAIVQNRKTAVEAIRIQGITFGTEAELAKEAQEAARLFATNAEYDSNVADITGEASNSFEEAYGSMPQEDSGFMDLVAAGKSADLQQSLDGASYSAASGEADDEFFKMLRGDK